MAKFARVGYGHDGRGAGATGEGYIYLVNDNVRAGDILQPIAHNKKSGKAFVTTGQVLRKSDVDKSAENKDFATVAKVGSAKGNDMKQKLDEAGTQATQVYTGKELGVSNKLIPQRQKQEHLSQYGYVTRVEQAKKYAQENPNAQFSKNAEKLLDVNAKQYTNKVTNRFDEYSKPFMRGGE